MSAQPVHLENDHSYTGNECRTPWDSVLHLDPDPVTTELEKVTCKPCKVALVARGVCPECGEETLVWSAGPVKLNTVADGRLTMRDVETQFYLGCESCSETLITGVTPDEVARMLTQAGWRPAGQR